MKTVYIYLHADPVKSGRGLVMENIHMEAVGDFVYLFHLMGMFISYISAKRGVPIEKVCAALNEIATNGEISWGSTLPESEYEVPHGLDF